jgi:hypothetical protein
MGEAKRKAERRAALNDLCDRIEAIPPGDKLAWVKAMVAETLKRPEATEETKLAVLAEMENGGYEALLHMLMNQEIPEGFDPKNRPWNRN